MVVFDVVTESLELDLAGFKLDLGRAPKPAGVVDDAHGLEGRSMRRAVVPDVQGLQRSDGTGQQRGRAIVRFCGAFPHQYRGDTTFGERYCRG